MAKKATVPEIVYANIPGEKDRKDARAGGSVEVDPTGKILKPRVSTNLKRKDKDKGGEA